MSDGACLKTCKIVQYVMLNSFQHPKKSKGYDTLNRFKVTSREFLDKLDAPFSTFGIYMVYSIVMFVFGYMGTASGQSLDEALRLYNR